MVVGFYGVVGAYVGAEVAGIFRGGVRLLFGYIYLAYILFF